MQLESLKASKFEALPKNQLSAIRGGADGDWSEATGSGSYIVNNRTIQIKADCSEYNRNNICLYFEYQTYDGVWHHIDYAKG